MRSKLFPLLGSALAACFAATCAHAQLANENLIAGAPEGYKIGFQQKTDKAMITEFVPQSETVENWTAMVTHQLFYGATRVTPAEFEQRMKQSWKKGCAHAEDAHIGDGLENGYAFSFWLQTCDLNAETGKPEATWLKAIQGKDSFYVVQKAFRSSPSKERAIDASRYLRSVLVCDTRGAEHPCPAVGR